MHVVSRARGVEQARSIALQLEYDWKPEGGFVRSRMADRYLSKSPLQEAFDWPSDVSMSQQISIGDEQQWRMHFDVKSVTPSDELVRRVGEGLDSMRYWTRQPGSNQWISHQEGHRVALDVSAIPGAGGLHYGLELKVSAEREWPGWSPGLTPRSDRS